MIMRTRKKMVLGGPLQVGDRVSRIPVCFMTDDGYVDCAPKTGTVIYIHPERRFHMVEFKAANGYTWRESYFGGLDFSWKKVETDAG